MLVQEDYLYYGLASLELIRFSHVPFSVLVIAAIIEYDVKKKVLDPDIMRYTVHKVIHYMMEEKDTRGFIQEKGWAHAIAHGADALDALAKHPLT